MSKTILARLLCLAVLVASPASADVLISNLAGADLSSTLFGPGSTTVFKAAGLTMPAGQDYFLDDVTLQISFVGSGQAQVDIWGGTSSPTTPLVTLNSPAQGGAGNFTFTPPSPFVLTGGTTYWVYVSAAPGSDPFNWIASSVAPSGIAANAGYNFNGSPSTFMNKYEVRGTLVPEPISLGWVCIVIWGVSRLRR